MRISGRALLFGIALLGWLVAAGLAMIFVARVGPLGLGIIGVLVWFICVRMDLEKEGAVGSAFAAGLYAQQIRAREDMTRSEKAALRHEQTALVQSLRFVKHLGIALAAIGFATFAFYQL